MSTATFSALTSTTLTQLQQNPALAEEAAGSTDNSPANSEAATPRSTDLSDDVASSSNSLALPSSPAICSYFQRGVCRFGSMCRFSHELPGAEVSTSASSSLNGERPSTSRGNWANAPAFVPLGDKERLAGGEYCEASNNEQQYSWADVVFGPHDVMPRPEMGSSYDCAAAVAENGLINDVCPFESPCPYGIYCAYAIHMDLCEMCDQYCLHPSDEEQRKKHNKECLQQHEQAMELSFAIARSKDKTCGICFDTIMEKAGREKRFGILPNCNHIFCLECIRKWRQAKQFEHKITRSCPECRVSSDFVCPSAFWVETKDEKEKLLGDYLKALGIKDCKYFKKGDGKCPFGNKCFYKHALPNGKLVDVGCPKKARKMHRSNNEIINLLDIYLYEFLEHRNLNFLDFFSSAGDDDSSDEDSM